MRFSSSILVRFLVLSLVSWGGYSPAADSVSLSTQEQQIATLLTTASGQQRPEMILDPILTEVARAQASDMAANSYFSDTNPQGYGPDALVMQKGYVLPASYGTAQTANYIESIGAGYSTASGVLAGLDEFQPSQNASAGPRTLFRRADTLWSGLRV